ncbi:S8 family serine peptidase [Undibacterium sp.]|uniref:S8 family serine peptidase n=1 Tax=Undibacterium sp. TaxID=1914977 RepID=UPI003750EB15
MKKKSYNDPLFEAQWYLVNTGQRGGTSRIDINILSAWEKYTGKGILIAVNDDGMDLTHPSLIANLRIDLVYDGARQTIGQGFVNADSSHGTVVGSIIGMAANDGIGGVGVAYDAKIIPGLVLADGVDVAKLFLANLAAGASISVNSWGQDPAFAENFGVSGTASDIAWGAALIRAANEARDGLGMIIEVSGGNERQNRADVSLSNFTNNKLVIAVGAIDEHGKPTEYSTPGASLLVTAPGGVTTQDQSVNSGYGIMSADVQGAAGYNKTEGTAGDYAYQSQGTSYSGPMVGGAAALILQANPSLGFRDVASILAMTARKVDEANPSWVMNKALDWNLGGMHFSRDFGYGLIDVSAATRLAESWSGGVGTYANWKMSEGASNSPSAAIPDNDSTILSVSATLTDNIRIERMEFDLNLTADSPSQLAASITSPSGTTIMLFELPLTRPLVEGAPNMTVAESAWPQTFTIGSTAFLGETSIGTWTLRLADGVTGVVASYNSLTVRAWGSAISLDSQYVMTNEFGSTDTILNDENGIDTINASATATATNIRLQAGQLSTVGTGSFMIGNNTTIENAIGGLGDDVLIGNVVSNVLRGNAGNDQLDGGAGIDTAFYLGSRKDYSILKQAGNFSVEDKLSTDGIDQLSNMEIIKFSDMSINLKVGENAKTIDPNSLKSIIELYIAYFNRVPDADGMSYWIDQNRNGTSIEIIGTSFYNAAISPVFSALTGYSSTMSNVDFVKIVYLNVLGRTEVDAEGLNYWSNALTTGDQTRGTLIKTMLDSAHSFKGRVDYGWVADLLDNKVLVGTYFAIQQGINFNSPQENYTKGVEIAKLITPTDVSAAIALVGINDTGFSLV